MVEHLMFIHITCLFPLAFGWTETFNNVSDVARQYTEFCGSHTLCNEKIIYETFEERNGHRYSSVCPSCSCTKSCHVTGNCCPDIALSKCIPTKHYINSLDISGDIYHNVVSFCPLEDGKKEPTYCLLPTDETNVLTQIPVTSTRTKISYASKQCAECHNDTEVLAWSFNINCQTQAIDLSVISEFSELVVEMKQKNCSVKLDPPPDYAVQSCWKESVIRKCNVTGLWDKPDEDLETACTVIWSPYGSFQNVFCFLCNTDSQHRQQFLLRKETNDSKSYSDVTEQCDVFENKSCSSLVFQKNWHVMFTDATVFLTEEKYVNKNGTYIANIEFSSSILATKIQDILVANSVSKITPNIPSVVNLTSLFDEYVRSGGYEDWCLEDHKIGKLYPGLRGRRTCSCDQDCYLTSSCCPDAAYYQQKSCIRPFLGELTSNFFVQSVILISRCPIEYKNRFVKNMCEKTEYFDILHIPVIDVRNNNVYKNSYCFLCSDKNNLINESIPYIKPWNVSMVCPEMFFPMIFSSMESMLTYAGQIGCFLHFNTIFYVENCYVDLTINKCNSTGLSISVSENAQALCEDPAITSMTKSKNKMYRNIICDLCNSEFLEDPIFQCNVTGTWNLEDNFIKDPLFYTNQCANQPLEDYEYPFKNAFCKNCNIKDNRDGIFAIGKGSERTYRQLFSILEMSQKESSISADSCNAGEVYDSYRKTCRKLHCSIGKLLHQENCMPLINDVERLRYSLAFKILMISLETDMTIPLSSLYTNVNYYLETLFLELHVSITVIQSHFYVQKPCSFVFAAQSPIEVLVYTQIQITQPTQEISLNRSDLENKILNLTEWSITLEGISLNFEENAQAWYLPIRKGFSLSQKECMYHEYQSMAENSVGNVYFFDVNKLLKCPQIQLDDSEFTFLDNQLEISVPLLNRNFLIHEFVRSKNGKVQICAESYKRVSSEQSILMETVLAAVTLIVTIVSLICSFITFVAYCILPVLRTVPGKNIMCFTFSLFFAQLLFLIRSYINNKLVCLLIGSLMHYFWISVFVCSNVCCFHMFKLFVGSSLVQSNKLNEWKLVFRYCFLSYALPTLPIVLNLAFHYLGVQIGGDEFGYGGTKCFLLSSLALLLTFIVPILLQILINIAMFSVTFHYIRNTPKVQSSKDRNDFSIFLKLFLLTGISWFFMVVDGFFEMSLFTFLTTFLNGTQGLFLFVSYICNKKVWVMLRKKWGKAVPTQGTSTSELTLVRSSQYIRNHSIYSEITEAVESTGNTF